jgi:hypothetical protein
MLKTAGTSHRKDINNRNMTAIDSSKDAIDSWDASPSRDVSNRKDASNNRRDASNNRHTRRITDKQQKQGLCIFLIETTLYITKVGKTFGNCF